MRKSRFEFLCYSISGSLGIGATTINSRILWLVSMTHSVVSAWQLLIFNFLLELITTFGLKDFLAQGDHLICLICFEQTGDDCDERQG